MTTSVTASLAADRGRVYAALSRAFLYPTADLFAAFREGELTAELRSALDALPEGPRLVGALKDLEDALARTLALTPDRAAWEAEYGRLFTFGEVAAPPYEAEYTGSHIFMQTQEMADVGGFYKAFGIDVNELSDRPDHLPTELEFMYVLCLKEAWFLREGDAEGLQITRDAERRFLEVHLGRWIRPFKERLERHARLDFYRSAGVLTDRFVQAEVERTGAKPEVSTGLKKVSRQGFDQALFADAGDKGGLQVEE